MIGGASMYSFFGSAEDNSNANSNKNNSNKSQGMESSNKEDGNNETICLHKEELDINKNKVQSGEVIINKEVVEEKTVEVPVTHEEVVIERKVINKEVTDTPIGPSETIRIPLREEQVQVSKQTVLTEEITAKIRQVEENKK